MTVCPKCRGHARAGAAFCDVCGTQLTASVAKQGNAALERDVPAQSSFADLVFVQFRGAEAVKAKAIKAIRELTGAGYAASKTIVEGPSTTIIRNISREHAIADVSYYRSFGIELMVVPVGKGPGPTVKSSKTPDRNAILLGCGFLVALIIGVVKGAMVDSSSSSSKAADNGTSIMYSSPAPVVDQNADRRYAFRKYWNTVADTVRTCGYAIGFAQASAEAQNDEGTYAMLHRASDCGDRVGRYASDTNGDDDLEYVAETLAQAGWDLRDGTNRLAEEMSAGERDHTDAYDLVSRAKSEMHVATLRMHAKYAKIGGNAGDIRDL